MPKMPRWKSPKNLAEALADGDGIWEDERWAPLLVTAMSGTEYQGRAIPVAWQLEFDPSEDEFAAASARIEEDGGEPDGYGWGEYIRRAVQTAEPALAARLHLTDCESAACVIWVETEADCRALVETTWKLAFAT